MIKPRCFGFNDETATTNLFQIKPEQDSVNFIREAAIKEFENMVSQIRNLKIEVEVFNDVESEQLPDSVFLNNWFSTHSEGFVFVYPMLNMNRRKEVRDDIIDWLIKQSSQTVQLIDLRIYEAESKFCEGTGSIVIDHEAKIVYAALSARTNEETVKEMARILKYRVCTFNTIPVKGTAVYHTNVLMTITSHFYIICEDLINEKEREKTDRFIRDSGKQKVLLSKEQINCFAGNMLEVENTEKQSYLLMSQSALNVLKQEQVNLIQKYHKIAAFNIPVIEKTGGGSVRCMIAENFLS